MDGNKHAQPKARSISSIIKPAPLRGSIREFVSHHLCFDAVQTYRRERLDAEERTRFLHSLRLLSMRLVVAATHLQRTPANSNAMLPQSWLQQPTGAIQSNQSLQACQQKLRLQSLQMERERLKQRQQEIMRQVNILDHHLSLLVSSPPALRSRMARTFIRSFL